MNFFKLKTVDGYNQHERAGLGSTRGHASSSTLCKSENTFLCASYAELNFCHLSAFFFQGEYISPERIESAYGMLDTIAVICVEGSPMEVRENDPSSALQTVDIAFG